MREEIAMKQTKQKQVIPEDKLKEVTGGAQARDADVARATPVDEGSLVTPVQICPVCNTVITGVDKQCITCKTNAQNPVGVLSNENKDPLVQVPPYRVR